MHTPRQKLNKNIALYSLIVLLTLSLLMNLYFIKKMRNSERFELIETSAYRYDIGIPLINKNLITLIDKDEDGIFDYLGQSISDDKGEWLRDVIDYNFDGYADVRVENSIGGFVWFNGNWHKLIYDKNKDKKYIEIDGNKIELTKDNSLLVKWHRTLFSKNDER